MNQRKTKKYMGYSGLLVILLIAIDQFTKWLAYTHLYQKPDVSVIDGVFQLKYLENDSAAFSLDPVSILQQIFHFTYFDSHPEAFLMAKMIFFAVLTIVVLVLLAIVYQRIPLNRRFLPLNIIPLQTKFPLSSRVPHRTDFQTGSFCHLPASAPWSPEARFRSPPPVPVGLTQKAGWLPGP